ncbi:MAG: putative signal transducing protein [Schleiferiaceae bacterium]
MSSRKLLYVASTPTEANLITSYLEGNSIRVELEHLTMASVLPVGGNLSIKIFVFEAQWERALDLLKTYVAREKGDS